MSQTYNIPDHKRGDTFDGVSFAIQIDGSPANLTGVVAKIEFRESNKTGKVAQTLTSESGGGLSISGNTVSVDSFIPALAPGKHWYDLQLTWPGGRVKTYVEGTWDITQDVTQ